MLFILIPDIPILILILISTLIRSFTCTLSQAVDSQCKLEWYIVAYCAFQFNHRQICHPRASGRDSDRLIDLKLCPGCARTSGVSSSKGHRAQIGYTHFRRGWKRDGPVLITYVRLIRIHIWVIRS